MNVLANHLTHIDILTWVDEELAAILELVDSIGEGITCLEGYHRTIHTTLNLALIRLILLEAVRHDGLALRGCQHIGAQSDNTT